MKERPILFSAPMVRALLAGTKTQTRRIVKPQPADEWRPVVGPYHPLKIDRKGEEYPGAEVYGGSDENEGRVCPYGQPGDRLYVRETWGVISSSWDEDGEMVDWTPDRPAKEICEMPYGRGYYSGHVIYSADGPNEWAGDDDGGGEPRSAWHPSIHMPRAASRILLEIVSVRVERLSDCSESDAMAEGATPSIVGQDLDYLKYRGGYQTLWDSINGAGNWNANPWVWVIEFKRIEA